LRLKKKDNRIWEKETKGPKEAKSGGALTAKIVSRLRNEELEEENLRL